MKEREEQMKVVVARMRAGRMWAAWRQWRSEADAMREEQEVLRVKRGHLIPGREDCPHRGLGVLASGREAVHIVVLQYIWHHN